ncbi:MAG: 3-isopropylmalate dehydrogenase, partial [Candidatus Zixiibacteriota bacterium]
MRKNNSNRKKMTEQLKKSPAYRIAYHDHDFIDGDDLRPVRLQLELLKPELVLRKENIISTIVVFGGTRILEPRKAAAQVRRIESGLKRRPNDSDLKRQLRRAGSILAKSHYYDEAREFGRLVSQECQ